ncbi:GPI mannosyltransferase 1 [Microplitis demolitor]|uniref:GPI mannosyltransferase 1 n=1 Tax=Microplitis demolitor TaxID=69319 RepID=UPI0004CCE1CA|nr:GPI mannosyltransferase 1 [Microplitis demolitor]
MKWPEFKVHCYLAFILRILLIIYANFHDKYFRVPYTDIDYKVYTDAARYITNRESPYLRHTYRYTPLLALILTPNIFLHYDFGKLLFSLIDIIAGVLIKIILTKGNSNKYKNKIAELCALSWIYNPMTIIISTRGNADSLSVVIVLLTLYYLIINKDSFITGLIHGLSVHFRLYPIIFSLIMYLSYRDKHNIVPNRNQFKFITGCMLSLFTLTLLSYYYYGYEFIYESLIYHLIRKDGRHNFSLYFYMHYLSVGQPTEIYEKIIRILPPILLLVALSFRYSNNKNKIELSFGIMTQAMVMVTYNSVVTSQYFFWYLSLLPICIPYINISFVRFIILLGIWIIAQALWLFDAYCLEFLGLNKFHSIWIDSILFFFANIKILYDFIVNYDSNMLNKYY